MKAENLRQWTQMEQNFIQYVYRQYVYHSFSLQMRYLYRVSDEESGGRRFFLHRATTKGQFGRTCPETYEKKKKIVALFDRETNLLFLVSLMKLHRGMYTLKQFILMSISAIFGRDHSLLIAWGGGRCRNIFFFQGEGVSKYFFGGRGVSNYFFSGESHGFPGKQNQSSLTGY